MASFSNIHDKTSCVTFKLPMLNLNTKYREVFFHIVGYYDWHHMILVMEIQGIQRKECGNIWLMGWQKPKLVYIYM